jgi:MbtH protein
MTTTNPFEDPEGSYRVVVNDEGQHALWPSWANVPAGWSGVYGPDARDACLAYVEANWTDMRPASLVRTMDRRDERPSN